MARSRRAYLLPEMRAHTSAASTGTGIEFPLGGGFDNFGIEVVKTATTRGYAIQLQGSISGGSSSWKTLVTWATSGGQVSGDIRTFSSAPYTYVRAAIVTAASSETASVWISASY